MANHSKQQNFKGKGFIRPSLSFGGKQFATCNPKMRRPLDSKFPIHVVLRARRGGMRLPKAFHLVNGLVQQTATKHGVKVYDYANVGNHLHLAIRVTRIHRWAPFIRELTGQLAQLMQQLGIVGRDQSFWLYRPFTRVVKGWQKAFRTLREYIKLNRLEADGFISRTEIKNLRDFRAIFADG